jgi:hypothetical protein
MGVDGHTVIKLATGIYITTAIQRRIITVCIVQADTVFRDSIRIGGNGFGFIVDKNLVNGTRDNKAAYIACNE